MAHEQARVARRSASHGALNTSYFNQSRISSESGHLLPPFRPLRSIREHQHTYLDPAATMEGMLRKTTETGDIGIFSIGKPNGLRPRASLGDLRRPSRALSRSSAVPPIQDDRRQLPSYRDSTSEIISMYGSENHSGKSPSGTLSPPWDDCGQRSYSMTTCDSKGYFSPRNIGPQELADFLSKGQRPRSPYPYPTRLARPGVRPSSPALNENGLVDYSRMVEINRIPQRTTHHPHKLLFPHQTTRSRPPLSMRYDINQSTLPPHDGSDSSRPGGSSLGNRPPLSNNPHLWRPGPRDRIESGSSDQSPRTMSLTSMSGRYSSVPLRISGLPPAPKKPLFYDYSEDFEDIAETPEVCPIAPIPRRVSNTFCPLITEDDHGMASDTQHEDTGDEDLITCLRRATMIENADHYDELDHEQYRPVSQLGQRAGSGQPSLRIASRLASVTMPETRQEDEGVDEDYDVSNVTRIEQERTIKNGTPKIPVVIAEAPQSAIPASRSADDWATQYEVPAIGSQTTRSDPPGVKDGHNMPIKLEACKAQLDTDSSASAVFVEEGNCKEEPLPNALESGPSAGTSSNRYSDYRKDSRLFSLSSGLSDLATFVKYIDRHIQSPDTMGISRDDASAVQSSRTAPGPDFEDLQAQNGKVVPPPPRKSSLRPCGAYNMESKYSPGLLFDDGIDQFQVVSTRSGPTLVPQPISPAKLLRVKNSIPQLMKALPPLPGYSPAPESPFGPAVVPIDFEPFEISRLTDARSTLTEAILSGRRGHSEDGSKGYDPFVFDRRAPKPRLKLKHAASCASGNPRDLRRGYFEKSGLDFVPRPSTAGHQPSHVPVKRRLPIKISRTALSSSESEENGTVRRRPDLKKSSTVSELASKQPLDLFGDPVTPKVIGVSVPQTAPAKPQETMIGAALQRAPLTKTRRIVNEGDRLPPFADIRLSSLDSPHADPEGHGEVGMQSFFSDNDINTPRRRLRTRISSLKAKLSEPRSHQQSHLRNGAHGNCGDGEDPIPEHDVPSTNAFKDLLSGMSQSRSQPKNATNRKVRSRLGRFMQGAKHKLRAWGHHRRRLD